MNAWDRIFYKEFKADLLCVPLVTLLMLVCLSLPLSLPFIIIYPLLLGFVMVRRARDGYKILCEMGTYERVEANRIFDNRFLSAFLLLFALPISVFNYFFVLGEAGLIQSWAKGALARNDYFLGLLYDSEILKPLFSDDIYVMASDPAYGAILYPFAVTFIMSVILAASMLLILRPLSETWRVRHDDLTKKPYSQQQFTVFRLLLSVVLVAMFSFVYFLLFFDLGFYRQEDSQVYRYLGGRFFKDLLVHSFSPFYLLFFLGATWGVFQKVYLTLRG